MHSGKFKESIHQESGTDNSNIQVNPIKILFSVVLVITGLVFLGLFLYSYSSFQRIRELKEHDLRVELLKGTIIHLDEVLTMSARMAASTGDPQWEKRYHYYEPQLDKAIKEAVRLSPHIYQGKAAQQTDKANIKLVKMENESFDLIHQGRIEEAQAILFGSEYEEQKRVYANGMRLQAEQIRSHIDQTINLEGFRVKIFLGIFIAAVFILVFVWLAALKTIGHWQEVLIGKNRQLTKKSEELAQLNRQLDDKVSERTRELLDINRELSEKNEKIKQAQMQLLQSEKMASIGQLAAGVAHEINNPVGFIGSNIHTLEKYVNLYQRLFDSVNDLYQATACKDTEKTDKIFKQIKELKEQHDFDFLEKDIENLIKESKEGISRIAKIVNDLRTFSRSDKGETSDVTIEEVIDGILNIVQNEVKYKAVIKTQYNTSSRINCNVQHLGQVFINLIMNAVQAIDKDGEIVIKTYETGDSVHAHVRDNGNGIPQKDLKMIFDPFYTTKPVGKGTGLGLSISYEIVKKYNGNLTVESELSKGSTFTVTLPKKREQHDG